MLTFCTKKMTAKTIIEMHPIQAIHLGVSKSKTAEETSKQPTESAKWIANADPPPNNTWVTTAIGSAGSKTVAPREPRGERTLEPSAVLFRDTTPGRFPTSLGSTLWGLSVISLASFLLLLQE